MADTSTSKKRLALAIIDFLNTSVKDGTVPSEEAESMEIATNCIAESFKVDPADSAAMSDAIGTQNLLQIYGVFEKLKGKGAASSSSSSASNKAAAAADAEAAGPGNAHAKEEAEQLKAQGNAAMQKKDYNLAIDLYSRALALAPLNPIYLSNRAAAYSGARMHAEAKEDAEMAVAADPKYTKAWSRLGLANYALGDSKGSTEAYQKGIEAEGNGGSETMRKGYETAKKRVEEEGGLVDDGDDIGTPDATRGAGAGGMPDLSSLAGMFGGGGGGGGGGGMPDLSSLMQNPMMRQMAENIMSNPEALSNIMNNPQLREMAGRFGGGGRGGGGAGGAGGAGGMPDLSSLMNDPSIAEMARNFMGGGAGRGGAGAGAGRGR